MVNLIQLLLCVENSLWCHLQYTPRISGIFPDTLEHDGWLEKKNDGIAAFSGGHYVNQSGHIGSQPSRALCDSHSSFPPEYYPSGSVTQFHFSSEWWRFRQPDKPTGENERLVILRNLNMFKVHSLEHEDINWKHFPRYWPFLQGIHRSTVNSPHKGQWRGA